MNAALKWIHPRNRKPMKVRGRWLPYPKDPHRWAGYAPPTLRMIGRNYSWASAFEIMSRMGDWLMPPYDGRWACRLKDRKL